MVIFGFVLSVESADSPARIAIVGGGLAGLGTAAHLLLESQSPITALHVYDAALPGKGGASAVAAGLLHPFTPRSKEIWMGQAGYAASVDLLSRVEACTGPCSTASGLLRLALSEEQAEELQSSVDTEVSAVGGSALGSLRQHWLGHEGACERSSAQVGGHGGVWAESALCVDVPKYVQGLWALCQTLAGEGAAQWRLGEVDSLSDLAQSADYDAVVIALGSRAPGIVGLESLPLTPCRGQNLILSNEVGLAVPVISGKYLVPTIGDDGTPSLLAGATFEYDSFEQAHRPAEAAAAEEALRKPLGALLPHVESERVLGCQAGVRALPPRSHLGYVPIAGKLGGEAGGASCGPDVWLVGGLGSRGLIHHALIGKATARAVLRREETELPEHVRRLQDKLDACAVRPA